MDRRMLCVIVAILLLSIFSQATFADQPDGKGKSKQVDAVTQDPGYAVLDPLPGTVQERAFCTTPGVCYYRTLTCPVECPQRKPRQNKKQKGCYIDCGSKCEATCKWRLPRCDGYGALCYDPRFVGGDGVMFYFHGAKDTDFAIVSDDNLHINAHLIGTRPKGRKRDFTWVQKLSVMFDAHTLVVGAKEVSHWDEKVDALTVQWNSETVDVPTEGDAEWSVNTAERSVVVERTDDLNSVRVTVSGLLQQPGYVSPVKRGVPMPIMGGEDKYQTKSLHSAICNKCRFQRSSSVASA